jgi:hypothetical protein
MVVVELLQRWLGFRMLPAFGAGAAVPLVLIIVLMRLTLARRIMSGKGVHQGLAPIPEQQEHQRAAKLLDHTLVDPVVEVFARPAERLGAGRTGGATEVAESRHTDMDDVGSETSAR